MSLSRSEEKGNSGLKQQLIVFKLGGNEYALTIDQVKEVVVTPEYARIPNTSNYIKGVGNVRGNILAILDIEEKFNLDKDTGWKGNYILVIESERYKVGLLSGDVPETLSVDSALIDTSFSLGNDSGGVSENYITGIVKLEDRLIILMDVFKVLNEAEMIKVLG